MEFDWDDRKALRNLAKHRVSFDEATTVFDDEASLLIYDEEHSEVEDRYRIIGFSDRGRILVVAHCEVRGIVRIISARKATKLESVMYEQNRA